MEVTYERNGEVVEMVLDEPTLFNKSEQTARNDSRILVSAGRYPMVPVLIDGRATSIGEAYYFAAQVEGTLYSGGYPDQKLGSPATVKVLPYGYVVRENLNVAAR